MTRTNVIVAILVVILTCVPAAAITGLAIADWTNSRSATVQAHQIEANLSEVPGGLAWDYLQNALYSNLVVEIVGFSDVGTLLNGTMDVSPFAALNATLAEECNKDSISFVTEPILPAGLRHDVYTLVEVRELAKHARLTKGSDTCVLHIFALNGFYDGTGDSLALSADTIVVFPQFIPVTWTSGLINHKFGHLLGLVGSVGPDSPFAPPASGTHEDASHPGDCSNPECSMHFSAPSYELCPQCKWDLAHLRAERAPYACTVGIWGSIRPA